MRPTGKLVSAIALSVSAGAMIEPAQAQPTVYHAVPVTASRQNVIVDGVMWLCNASECAATNATSRPAIACAQAVRKIGRLASFAVGTVAFGDVELTTCNAKAKP